MCGRPWRADLVGDLVPDQCPLGQRQAGGPQELALAAGVLSGGVVDSTAVVCSVSYLVSSYYWHVWNNCCCFVAFSL